MDGSPRLCVRCGYDLAGLGGDPWGTCPECGLSFDPEHPYPKKWPHPAKLTVLLLGPTTLLAIANLMAARCVWVVAWPINVLLSYVAAFLAVAFFIVPVYVGWRIACAHAVAYERLLIWLILMFVGELYAVGLAFCAVMILSTFWP